METFGSDAAPPEINSVRRVRESDLFVGIYAHRYGTVDEASGKSITELELDEASASLSAGVLRDILLFIIDENSVWLSEYREDEAGTLAGLSRLRSKARSHTFTSFSGRHDLVFCVTRDVVKRVSQLLGASPRVREAATVQPRPLRRPVGMEYLRAEQSRYFLGRADEVSALTALVQQEPIVLLLGESGIGKTSVVHAGLIPQVTAMGWRAVCTRPLGLPCTDVTRQLLATMFEGQPFYRGSLLPLLGEVSGAIQGQRLLLIIDQFEDILLSRDQGEVDSLLADLRILRTIHAPGVAVLIVYRSDLEGRLGMSWQAISGSPLGLPRFYLQGLAIGEAWESLNIACTALGLTLSLRAEEEERIKSDLFSQSDALGCQGVYPPYVQMALDHLWGNANEGKYEFASYQHVGGMEGIIGGYLGRQLNYAQDSQGKARAVLVSLVRSYGVKAQKEMREICADTGLPERDCDQAIEKLIDLRLVRHIPPYYEISHDFIARRIADELVDSEEREFKRFRELLTSKTAAFRTTRCLLTKEEQLMLYKHRQRLLPSHDELRLILSTWVRNGGPGLFWLLDVETSIVLSWLRAEEADQEIEAEAKASIVLLRRKLGEMPLAENDYQAFRRYQLSAELAALIVESGDTIPKRLLVLGLRHKREEVREASITAAGNRIAKCDLDLLDSFSSSRSAPIQEAFEELVLRRDVPLPRLAGTTGKAARDFVLLKTVALASSPEEARAAYRQLTSKRVPKRTKTFALALLAVKQGRLQHRLRSARSGPVDVARVSIKAARCVACPEVFSALMQTYGEWNRLEADRHEKSSLTAKAKTLATTIRHMMQPRYLNGLRRCFRHARLTSSSRDIALALLQFGRQSDLRLVLERIENEPQGVDYWNHTELGRATGRNASLRGKGIPDYLRRVITAREFAEYVSPSERARSRPSELLPLASIENRALYVRLAAYAAIGASARADAGHLLRLTRHQYSLIARAAALRLVELFGGDALGMLSDSIDAAMLEGKTNALSEALRSAELKLYAVMDT